MRIQHNIMAMNAYRNLNINNRSLSGNLEKLSSGYKINRAGDDAAGLAISEKMRAQITALDAAQKNVNDGISLVKTAEGAMQEIQDMLNRMEYLATQSANGTYDNDVDRNNLQKEVNALRSEINRIADASNFNGTKLLNGDLVVEEETMAITGTVAGADVSSITDLSTATFADGDEVTINSKTYTYADAPDATAGQFSTYEELKTLAAKDGVTLSNTAKTSEKAAIATTAGAAATTPTVTDPNNNAVTYSDGAASTSNATITLNLAGMSLDQAGSVKFTVCGKNYTIAVADSEKGDASAIADKLVTAMNADKITDTNTGDFTAVNSNGTITLTSTNQAAKDSNSTALATGTVTIAGVAGAATAGYAEITFDDTKTGADYLGSTVTVDGKVYEFVADEDAVSADTNVAVVIGETDDADAIATALKGATDGTGGKGTNVGAVAVTDNVVKFTHKTAGAGNDIVAAATAKDTNGSSAVYSEGGLKLQIGDTSDTYNQMTVKVGDMHADAMGTFKADGTLASSIDEINISTQAGAADAVEVIKNAINYVSGVRGDLGAIQNRLEHTNNNLAVMEENIQDAESTIRDTDIADEMMAYTKNNILIQSAQAMLAQANQVPQGVLQLMQ